MPQPTVSIQVDLVSARSAAAASVLFPIVLAGVAAGLLSQGEACKAEDALVDACQADEDTGEAIADAYKRDDLVELEQLLERARSVKARVRFARASYAGALIGYGLREVHDILGDAFTFEAQVPRRG